MNLVECPSHPLLKLSAPVVFDGMIDGWPASKWTPETLAETLGEDVKIDFRIGTKSSSDIEWENGSRSVRSTAQDYVEWLAKEDPPDSNPLSKWSKSVWMYAAYKYMAVLFRDKPELLESVDWSVFGFGGRAGYESTFWMGSGGAYTQCHYDTYGCNLVAQVYGRKRWILFPPEDTKYMYPTRLPFEESSVYSAVNIRNPDLRKHPDFVHCHPYIVTLQPGQVLFVPRHWWHLVECEENSISINSWIEMADDVEGRLEEAVTGALITSVLRLDPELEKKHWENFIEEPPSVEESRANLLHSWQCLSRPSSSLKHSSDTIHSAKEGPYPSKKQKTDENDPEKPNSPQDTDFVDLRSTLDRSGVPVKRGAIEDIFMLFNLPKQTLTDSRRCPERPAKCDLTPKYLMKCATHPEVVSLICKIMKENGTP